MGPSPRKPKLRAFGGHVITAMGRGGLEYFRTDVDDAAVALCFHGGQYLLGEQQRTLDKKLHMFQHILPAQGFNRLVNVRQGRIDHQNVY